MVSKSNNRTILLVLAALGLAILACTFGRGQSQTPTPRPIPITTEAVDELQDELESAATQASTSGRVTIEVTEAQLTSMVALELESQEEPALQNPQVYLRNGQVELHGQVQQSGLSLPLKVVANVTADDQGKPDYEIVSATLGPLPLPQALLDEISDRLDESLSEQLGAESDNVFVEDIVIADGKMTITGHTQ